MLIDFQQTKIKQLQTQLTDMEKEHRLLLEERDRMPNHEELNKQVNEFLA